MGYGHGRYGYELYGGPPPDEFEEQSEPEKDESYRELYEKLEQIVENQEQAVESAERWRRRTRYWQIVSILVALAGFLVGLLL
jgi:ElaB/YqjD/DUF883 family membrane-anchored ribosome-binding protein